MNQRKYTLELLDDTRLAACTLAGFPMEVNIKLSKAAPEPLARITKYRRLIGKLLYLTITRPNIAFAVNTLSHFLEEPCQVHYNAAWRIVRYLKGTPSQGLFYPAKSDMLLRGFTDSDWAACVDTRRSITGYCMFLGNSLVSWKSKKQHVVSKSSSEAEYRALSMGDSEVVWLQHLLLDLQVPGHQVCMYTDSKSVIALAENNVQSKRTNHIKIDCHYIREQVLAGVIHLLHVYSRDQVADILTKPLGSELFHRFVGKIGLLDYYAPS